MCAMLTFWEGVGMGVLGFPAGVGKVVAGNAGAKRHFNRRLVDHRSLLRSDQNFRECRGC